MSKSNPNIPNQTLYRGQKLYANWTFLLFWCLLAPINSFAQDASNFTHNSFAEKIYLQLDRKIYTNDQTIWYKCVLVRATDHTPSRLSGVLYVELIGPDAKMVEKKLIKIRNGVGKGYFVLNQQFASGQYLVRAYTEWNKNFGSDFIFKEYIRIFDSEASKEKEPIRNLVLIEKAQNRYHLQAILDPLVIDSLHKKELKIFVTTDGVTDSLTIKKDKGNNYLLDYPLPLKSQLVTLHFQSKNHFTHTKTIALDEEYLDLQFFPESGEMVHGLKCIMGFKALDYTGKGKKISGEIVNQWGDRLAMFESNSLGMGTFTIAKADSNTIYNAKLKSHANTDSVLMIPLPAVTAKGNVLSVVKRKDKFFIQAFSNYLPDDTLYVRISCRGMGYYEIKGKLINGSMSFSLNANKLPEGIVAFTLIDSLQQIMAERLFFNERPETRINIQAAMDRNGYRQREQARLDIEVSDQEGQPIQANLSLLVINKNQLGEIQSKRQNILSYFLLSSDLKGEIENPGYYFNGVSLRHHNLDALMLTQGWRKYQYKHPVGEFHFQPEATLKVQGKVNGLSSKKRKEEVILTMMTFGKSPSVQTRQTDSLGRFEFNVDDEYGQNLNILIQSAKKSGKKSQYDISLNQKESLPITFNQEKSLEKVDSTIRYVVRKSIERKEIEDASELADGIIMLDEIVVSDYRLTPDRKKVLGEYGKPDVVIHGKDIMQKEATWSYGLYSVIKFNYPEMVRILKLRDFLYAEVLGSPGPTLVVIDGKPVMHYDYPLIPNIPPSSVSSFEIIKNSKAFRKHFLTVFPYVHPLDAPGFGNIIAIYTHAGKGLHGAKHTKGMLTAAVPVFSPPYEFYAPKHANLQPDDWYARDLRALIHWEPIITVDSAGKASVEFYNADHLGDMQIVIEAVSEKGNIGYRELVYEVTSRDRSR